MHADVIIIGAGLAGLAACDELVRAGRHVAIVEQENRHNLGGQAHWSFGGIFLVNSPMQRRWGVRDSFDLAWQDWQGSAQWDRLTGPHPEDEWGQRWGRAFVEWAADGLYEWLRERAVRFTPLVGWAERGDGRAGGHGNSVPRFHIPWGTGTGVSGPFAKRATRASETARGAGRVTFYWRHRVDDLLVEGGEVRGVAGSVLADDDSPRGVSSSREVRGDFTLRAPAVIVASGGIGGNHDLVRRWWPERLGTAPRHLITGVPAHVDGRLLDIAGAAGARLVNRDRMWHYTEGLTNWAPVWPGHAIRILPGPSSLWLDALGRPLPAPYLPGYDTLGTLRHLRTTPDIAGFDHSWFITTSTIVEKEFALSGSEQNPDLTHRDLKLLVRSRLGSGPTPPAQAHIDHGPNFAVAKTLPDLVRRMNALAPEAPLEPGVVERAVRNRDAEMANPYTKDAQVMGIHNARRYLGDRLLRVAKPHRLQDPAAGPLMAVKLHILTRKSLGGLQTDLESRVLGPTGEPVPGLYAAGEAAGFGGGGSHGYNSLEGTFLTGCLFTGRAAGQSLVRRL